MSPKKSYSEIDKSLDEAWAKRHAATVELSDLIVSKIKTLVLEQFPQAGKIVLYEDHSHDHPHAHLAYIATRSGDVLIEGAGDDWHEADYSHEIDELIWDLYHVHPALFKSQSLPSTEIGLNLGAKALVMSIDL